MHASGPREFRTLQIVVVPDQLTSALTFPFNNAGIFSEPGLADIGSFYAQCEILAEEILVQPAAVICGPAQHSVLHPPGIPVIKLVWPSMAPLQELTSRLRHLQERGETRHNDLNISEPIYHLIGTIGICSNKCCCFRIRRIIS